MVCADEQVEAGERAVAEERQEAAQRTAAATAAAAEAATASAQAAGRMAELATARLRATIRDEAEREGSPGEAGDEMQWQLPPPQPQQ
eukprot:scaffold104401_cov42-Phaeocystis_antarctica.AAC.1